MCIFIFIPLSTFNCLLFLLLWYCELLKLLLLCAIFTFPPAVTAACKWRYITLWFNNHRITNCNSIVLKCLLCVMLPFARQASQDLSSHVFVLSLIDRKISQFCCIFHTQCWVCHHLFHSRFQPIALSGFGCRHDGKVTFAHVRQLKTIQWEDINAWIKVACCWAWWSEQVCLVERDFWPTRLAPT